MRAVAEQAKSQWSDPDSRATSRSAAEQAEIRPSKPSRGASSQSLVGSLIKSTDCQLKMALT